VNIHSWIFSNDPAQSLRIKRLLSANNAYILVALLTGYSLWLGLLPDFPILSLIIVPAIPNIVFYTLIRTNVNLRFKDPSLTVPQTVYAIFAYMFLIYFADEARGAFLILALSTPIGIALRVRPKKLFWISLLPLLLLGCVIVIQHGFLDKNRNLSVDILEWFTLAGGIAWLSADGAYMARKRRETQESTQKLELALSENMALIHNLKQQKEIADAATLSNLAKSRLVAAANHDLRQPLHALSLFAAQLKDCSDEYKRIEITQKIESSITSINELFENLLDISRLDAGIITPNISSFSLQPLFNRLENTFCEIAAQKGLHIHFVKTHLATHSEFILLERILLNLIANALRYTEKGGVVIGCRARGEHIHIQVWDTGKGIAEDQQRNIFKEFFRIPTAIPQADAGLGLGLAIVERLCILLDHKIILKSMPNKGSCFTVVVPLVNTPETAIRAANDTVHITFNNKWVLIIDDELMVRDAMRSLLHEWGCNVLVAASSDEAMQLLIAQQTKPDLIISDYSLRDNTNGIYAITHICTYFNFNIPAFLISANTDPVILHEIRDQGYTVLNKPLKPMVLRALLNKYLML